MLDYTINSSNAYSLRLDGQVLEGRRGFISVTEDRIIAHILDGSLYNVLIKSAYTAVLNRFDRVICVYPYYLHSEFQELSIDRISFRINPHGLMDINIEFEFDFEKWHYPWTMVEHFTAFRDALFIESVNEYSWSDSANDNTIADFALKLHIDPEEIVFGNDFERPSVYKILLQDIVEPVIASIEKTNADVFIRLLKHTNINSLVVPFNFPVEVKVACQQYLLYFIQFLSDIGVNATAEITERAGQILFSVTPKDKNEALDMIRETLDIYLRLPTAPTTSNLQDIIGADIVVQRLAANIQHLQGQLILANATIQSQLATIQAKEARLQYLELSMLLMSGQVIVQSEVESGKTPDDDRESIIEGVLDVKRFDLLGVGELNLPEIVRRIKALVSQKKQL